MDNPDWQEIKDYKDLHIWQKSMNLAKRINLLTDSVWVEKAAICLMGYFAAMALSYATLPAIETVYNECSSAGQKTNETREFCNHL